MKYLKVAAIWLAVLVVVFVLAVTVPWVLAVVALVFPALFLGGICAAALEVRAEKKAGVPVTRPAWENRDKRRAVGGVREQLRAAWAQSKAKAGGITPCWCGCGPVVEFVDDGGTFGPGLGCAAWEAGHPEALMRHSAAGGYSRTAL